MSPRSKRVAAAAFTVLSLAVLAPLPGSAGETGKNPVIKFYQDHLSAADGSRCPMTPSCSEYAARAIKKHGPVVGWIMACDRLVRCGRDEARLAPTVKISGETYLADPVEANDFWWFHNDMKKKTE